MTRHLIGLFALASLALCLASPVLFFRGALSQESYRQIFAAGSLAWFVCATAWAGMRQNSPR